jgi:hypothetical protein
VTSRERAHRPSVVTGLSSPVAMGRRIPWLPALAAVIAMAAVPLSGHAQGVRYSGALQYSTGSYVFDARTHSLFLTNQLTFDARRFEASVSVPVILQNGGLVTMVGDRPVPTGGEEHGLVAGRRSGERLGTHRGDGTGGMPAPDGSISFDDAYQIRMGDPFVRVGAEVLSNRGALRSFRVTAASKVPIADLDSGVGTGEWDHTAGFSAMLSRGRFFMFGDLGYWWFGDLPELELRDGISWGLGLARPVLDGRGTLMASLSGAGRLIATLDPPVTAGAAFGYRLRRGWSMNVGLSAGVTESATDFSLSCGWSKGILNGP